MSYGDDGYSPAEIVDRVEDTVSTAPDAPFAPICQLAATLRPRVLCERRDGSDYVVSFEMVFVSQLP